MKTNLTPEKTEDILDKDAIHSYDVEYAPRKCIMVEANNRTQAAFLARQAGLDVRSVNFLG